MSDLGYGKDYQYAHDFAEKVTSMKCLPESLADKNIIIQRNKGMKKDLKSG